MKRFIIILFVIAISLIGAKSLIQSKQVMQITTNTHKLDVNTPNPGEIIFKASVEEKNIFRDASYAYYVKIYNPDAFPIWEHIYDLQSVKQNKLTTIKLPLQKVNVPSGTYKVYVELREDAFEEDMDGNILKPYHVIWGKTSSIIEVK
jgi:hypothetical protein